MGAAALGTHPVRPMAPQPAGTATAGSAPAGGRGGPAGTRGGLGTARPLWGLLPPGMRAPSPGMEVLPARDRSLLLPSAPHRQEVCTVPAEASHLSGAGWAETEPGEPRARRPPLLRGDPALAATPLPPTHSGDFRCRK